MYIMFRIAKEKKSSNPVIEEMLFENGEELKAFLMNKYKLEEIQTKIKEGEYLIYEFEGDAKRRKLDVKTEVKVSLK